MSEEELYTLNLEERILRDKNPKPYETKNVSSIEHMYGDRGMVDG